MRNRLLTIGGFVTVIALGCTGSLAKNPPPSYVPPPWAQTLSDIPADAAVRFGTLSNGMRYAILKNTMPPGQVSFRFRIAAGSLQETAKQQGLAHFLEHMAFRGSTHVPEGEVFHRMERLGAAPGADTNAFTSFSETVYMFDLPHNDAESIDTALFQFRETASELLIKAEAMATERKVVLSEERLGDTPARRMIEDQLKYIYKDQPVGDHLTIGSVKVVANAKPADIRAYYDAYYRPERATLIVVGDVEDIDGLEAKIKARFNDWQGRGKPGTDPVLGPPKPRSREVKIHVETGIPEGVGLDWTQPAYLGPDTKAHEAQDTVRGIAVGILNQRLRDISTGPNPPFINAQGSSHQEGHSATDDDLNVETKKGAWKQGLDAVFQMKTDILANGFTQDEIDRQVAQIRTALETAKKGAATRRSPGLANGLLRTVDADDVFDDPSTRLDLFNDTVKSLTVEQVNTAFRAVYAGNGPLVYVTSAEAVDGGEKAVTAAVDAPRTATAPADTAGKVSAWPYTDFGTPGKVAQQSTVDDLGLTLVRFENGVRLTIKPTTYSAEQVLVAVTFGTGRAGLDSHTMTPNWALNSGAFVLGGLKDLPFADMQRVLTGKPHSTAVATADNYFLMQGGTRPENLDTEMQVLAAHFTAPAWRDEAMERTREQIKTALAQMDSSAMGVFGKNRGELFYSGDPRWTTPSLADVNAATLEGVKSELAGPLADAPIEIAIVGNVTVEQAIATTAATFGALPPRKAPTAPPPAITAHFPAANKEPIVLHHQGRADQSIVAVAWPAMDVFEAPQAMRDLRLAHNIVRDRLFDQFRTKIGGTYSPAGELANSFVPGYGYDTFFVETPPATIPVFYETLAQIVADMKANPVSADELERARKPQIEGILKSQQTNEYWLTWLQTAQTDPRRLDVIRETLPAYKAVTAESIQKAAQTYWRDDTAWKLEIRPHNG